MLLQAFATSAVRMMKPGRRTPVAQHPITRSDASHRWDQAIQENQE